MPNKKKTQRDKNGTFLKTSIETEKTIIEAYTQGLTFTKIKNICGLSIAGLRNILARNNVPMRGQAKTRKYPPEKHEEAIRLYVEGQSMQQVADLIGIPAKVVKSWLRYSKITRPRKRVPQEIKDEIMRLYLVEKLTPREIGPRVGMTEAAVNTHVTNSGKRRSISEAQALAANKRPYKKGRGGYWQSSKTGQWVYAMSIMELLRMQQLDNDPAVKTWARFVPHVEWERGRYVADLWVEYENGAKVVEEVKPKSQHQHEENQKKWEAARTHFGALGVGFEIVDEDTVGGVKAIREFRLDGLQAIIEQERMDRKKAVFQAYAERNRKRIQQVSRARYERHKRIKRGEIEPPPFQ